LLPVLPCVIHESRVALTVIADPQDAGGGVDETVQVWVAAGPTLPAGSVARTENVCPPLVSEL
jgi:hypothetical protein